MVRTKADSCPAAGRKVVAARAPRKSLGASSSSAGSSSNAGASPSANKYAGGNPVCPRPTPEWQKGIASFFQKNQGKENKTPDEESGCSGSSSASASCQPSASNSSTSKSCAGTSSGSSSETKSSSRHKDDSSDEDES